MNTKKLSTIFEMAGIVLCLIGLFINIRFISFGIGILLGHLVGITMWPE